MALLDAGAGSGGGGSLDATDDPWANDGSTDTTTTDFTTGDSGSPDLDLGDADGPGETFDSSTSEGNVVDSDGDPDTAGSTIISDNNTDGNDSAQQNLTDEAVNATSGDGSIDSGVVDAESGEFVDGGTAEPSNDPTTDGDAGTSDTGSRRAAVTAGLVLLALLVLGGS